MHSFKRNKRLVGALILICSYGFIAYRLSKLNLSQAFENIFANIYLLVLLICVQLCLSCLNILIEAKKWKLLLSSIVKPSLISSVKMVLAGYASGIFTPAKLGEPLGRILFIEKTYWSRATILNYFGGALQNVVIFALGFFFLAFLSFTSQPQFKTILQYSVGFIVLSIFAIALLYVLKGKLRQFVLRLKWKEEFVLMLQELKQISFSKIITLQALSLFRYLVYALQLILFLLFFANDTAAPIGIVLFVPVYFLCITLVPSFVLADLGVRNSVALLLFSLVCTPQSGIMTAVSILWLLNQALPAILGSIFLCKQRGD